MLFQEWSKKYGILATHPTTERGAISIVMDINDQRRHDIWRFTDYKVDSTHGPVIWLLPVRNKEADEIQYEDLQAAGDFYDKLFK